MRERSFTSRWRKLAAFALGACVLALGLPAAGAVAAVPALVGFNDHAYNNGSENISQSLSAASAAGANVIRVDIGWETFETARGVYYQPHVTRLDSIINGAAALGMKTLLMVDGTPCWASTDPLKLAGSCSLDPPAAPFYSYPPSDPADYGHFVAWLTNRYGPHLAGVEVWNEPNAPRDENFISTRPAADYAALVVAAHAARTNGVPIVAGGLWNGSRDAGSTGDLAFMDQLFAQPGFGSSFDVFSTHSYGTSAANIVASVQQRRARLTQYGSGAPIWVDEFGWSTCLGDGCVSPSLQGDLLANTFQALTQPGLNVTGAISYELLDDGINPFEIEQNWGIMASSYLQKPSYATVSTCLHGGSCGSGTATATSGSLTGGSALLRPTRTSLHRTRHTRSRRAHHRLLAKYA